MAITPNINRPLTTTRCSGCGKQLHILQQAIWFDAMAEHPLLLGDCCADKVLGVLIQDYSKALTDHSPEWPSYWITELSERRMTAIANASKVISEVYKTVADLSFIIEGAGK